MNQLTKPEQPERSKINIASARHARSWAHALGVTQDELRCAVEKVGNSAALVKKEIERLRQHARDISENEGAGANKAGMMTSKCLIDR